MEVKQAVKAAKDYVADLFAEEHIRQIVLEEIEFDEKNRSWFVTIGFARPWEESGALTRAIFPEPRSYKVVRISDDNGRVISVKDRQPVAA
jgi:hypothetical protein